jgi:hypothetical protein
VNLLSFCPKFDPVWGTLVNAYLGDRYFYSTGTVTLNVDQGASPLIDVAFATFLTVGGAANGYLDLPTVLPGGQTVTLNCCKPFPLPNLVFSFLPFHQGQGIFSVGDFATTYPWTSFIPPSGYTVSDFSLTQSFAGPFSSTSTFNVYYDYIPAAAIPEPSAAGPLALAAVSLLLGLRRRRIHASPELIPHPAQDRG